MFTTKGVLTQLTREYIFSQVSEYQLWCHYLGFTPKMGEMFNSPVRNDPNPSAKLFETSTGSIILKDFGGKSWNIFSYLKHSFGWNLNEALNNIYSDFNLRNQEYKPLVIRHFKSKHKKILIKRKPWSTEEYQYWSNYHFTAELLKTLHISSISHYFIEKKDGTEMMEFRRKDKELLFAFSFEDRTYKIYRPFAKKKEERYIGSAKSDTLMGYDTLPWLSEVLVISKGMKELGVLRRINLPSTALQGENSYPGEALVSQIKKRFNTVYTIMDNDKAGVQASTFLQEKFGWTPLKYPEKYKDFADFGQRNPLYLINNLIKEQLT